MKPCPKCQAYNCPHLKKFFNFGLAKVLIMQKSLEATLAVFTTLSPFLPTNTEMQGKLNSTCEDLKKCHMRMHDLRSWYEDEIAP